MASSQKKENWLLVKWLSGIKSIVYIKSVVEPKCGLKLGDTLTVMWQGHYMEAKLLKRGHDHEVLESELNKCDTPLTIEEVISNDEDNYYSSGTSWTPSNEETTTADESGDEPAEKKKKLDYFLSDPKKKHTKCSMQAVSSLPIKYESEQQNLPLFENATKHPMSTLKPNPVKPRGLKKMLSSTEDCRNNITKHPMPALRVNPVKPNVSKSNPVLNTKRYHMPARKYFPVKQRGRGGRQTLTIPEIQRKRNLNLSVIKECISNENVNSQNDNDDENITIECNPGIIKEICEDFTQLYRMIDNVKNEAHLKIYDDDNSKNDDSFPTKNMNYYTDNTNVDDTKQQLIIEEEEPPEKEDEFDRSDDNILITNKLYNCTNTAPVLPETVKQESEIETEIEEWVPIGSGNTLIRMEQFKKINWKSYTVATRTLLLSVFSRNVLATHSLTGKKSPAFQNKPQKKGLDPTIVSDVIMEIVEKFEIRESYVRTIITIKCADEAKMLRMRNNIKNAQK